jgi:hypothetical protein
MSATEATKWGLVSTIKASPLAVLNFAAHHLDLGAHRLFIYLDAPDPETHAALKSHPKIRVKTCDAAHWKSLKGWRPGKHQVRQCLNATHAYGKAGDIDWITHIDVDEFIQPVSGLSAFLDAVPADTLTARMRPVEALAGAPDLYKGFIPGGPRRDRVVDALYPRFGRYLKGGFLSHVAGKIFVRTGVENVEFRIHNIALDGEIVVEKSELDGVALCHRHMESWDDWRARFAFRHEKGSYRAELPPARGAETAQTNLHRMLETLLRDEGEAGLRRFFEETASATPELCAKLEAEGLLHRCDLDLARKRLKHFPQCAHIVA